MTYWILTKQRLKNWKSLQKKTSCKLKKKYDIADKSDSEFQAYIKMGVLNHEI